MNNDMNINDICFGLSRQSDEESLNIFIRQFASPAVLEAIIPRLADEEITEILDFLSRVMGAHLKEKEYHSLFLGRKTS